MRTKCSPMTSYLNKVSIEKINKNFLSKEIWGVIMDFEKVSARLNELSASSNVFDYQSIKELERKKKILFSRFKGIINKNDD